MCDGNERALAFLFPCPSHFTSFWFFENTPRRYIVETKVAKPRCSEASFVRGREIKLTGRNKEFFLVRIYGKTDTKNLHLFTRFFRCLCELLPVAGKARTVCRRIKPTGMRILPGYDQRQCEGCVHSLFLLWLCPACGFTTMQERTGKNVILFPHPLTRTF